MDNKKKTYKRIENILDQGYVIFNDPKIFDFDCVKTNLDLNIINFYLDVIEKNISRMEK